MAGLDDKQSEHLDITDSPTEMLVADNSGESVGGKTSTGNYVNTQTQNGGNCNSNNTSDELSDSSEASSLSDSDRNKLPKVNCPEKIILCLDLSPEMRSVSFQSRANPRASLFELVMKTTEIFIKTKMKLHPKHEVAIAVLEDEASWYQTFSTNANSLCEVLNHLEPLDQPLEHSTFDMMSVMEILSSVELPTVDDLLLPPPHVVRVILVYGRSTCPPVMSDAAKQAFEKLMESPYFFFDVLYVHEIPSEENKCEEIYDLLCGLDEDECGYVLEVSRSTTRLFDHMASLLAHPLQRPRQRDTQYKLTEMHKREEASPVT